MLPKAEAAKAVHVATSLNFYFELLKFILHGRLIFFDRHFFPSRCVKTNAERSKAAWLDGRIAVSAVLKRLDQAEQGFLSISYVLLK